MGCLKLLKLIFSDMVSKASEYVRRNAPPSPTGVVKANTRDVIYPCKFLFNSNSVSFNKRYNIEPIIWSTFSRGTAEISYEFCLDDRCK